jgi:hypothetical protein
MHFKPFEPIVHRLTIEKQTKKATKVANIVTPIFFRHLSTGDRIFGWKF